MNKKWFSVMMGLLLAGGLISCKQSTEKEQKSSEATPKTEQSVINQLDTINSMPQYSPAISDEQVAALVKTKLQEFFKDDLAKDLIPETEREFIFYTCDLNSDGMQEIFVGLKGSYFCGSGGCTCLLLDGKGNKINTFTVVDYPIIISDTKSNGWNDLIMLSGNEYHLMKFNGSKYPSNPSVEAVYDSLPSEIFPRALNYYNEPYPWFSF